MQVSRRDVSIFAAPPDWDGRVVVTATLDALVPGARMTSQFDPDVR